MNILIKKTPIRFRIGAFQLTNQYEKTTLFNLLKTFILATNSQIVIDTILILLL